MAAAMLIAMAHTEKTPRPGFREWLWHRVFNRPYRLAVPYEAGKGAPVVLLHGIASNHKNWTHVTPNLKHYGRVIVPDLLGFGASPKPNWRQYTVQDHAREVIDLLKRKGIRRDVILVGHSMGCLIATEIARQKPRLVKKLILCSPPLYISPDAVRRAHSSDVYFSIYKQLIQREEFSLKTAALISKSLPRVVGFSLDRDTWTSFRLSLQNTIMHQTAFADLQTLHIPVELLHGRFDVFVMKAPLKDLAKLKPNIRLFTFNEPHEITPGYGKIIAKHIIESLDGGRDVV